MDGVNGFIERNCYKLKLNLMFDVEDERRIIPIMGPLTFPYDTQISLASCRCCLKLQNQTHILLTFCAFTVGINDI